MTPLIFLRNYAYNALCLASQAANTLLLGGDPDESLSSRAGKSIRDGGWVSDVPLPEWLRAHFLWSIEDDRGDASAWLRREIG